jgi:hypothetical protein
MRAMILVLSAVIAVLVAWFTAYPVSISGLVSPVLAAQLKSDLVEIIRGEMVVFTQEIKEIKSGMVVFTQEIKEIKSDMAEFKREIKSDIAEVKTALQELSEAVVTPTVAERVERCAPATALYMLAARKDSDDSEQCTAVPMFTNASVPSNSSTLFLTAAHCFLTPSKKARVLFDGVFYPCKLMMRFDKHPTKTDLAMLHCNAVPVPPSKISSLPYRLHSPAAILGFSRGLHSSGHCIQSTDSEGKVFCNVQHIRFTRLATSLLEPSTPSFNSSANASDILTNPIMAAIPFLPSFANSKTGYIDYSPERGMSGGAVVDKNCGLWGITRSKSEWGVGGTFVHLTPQLVQFLYAVADKFFAGE